MRIRQLQLASGTKSTTTGSHGFKTISLEESFTDVSSAITRINTIKEAPYTGLRATEFTRGNGGEGDYSSDNLKGFQVPSDASDATEFAKKMAETIKLESWNVCEKTRVYMASSTATKPSTSQVVVLKYTLKLDEFWSTEVLSE